ncbi:MAG TPA: VOC family protein [Acidimicrobiales bacterium]|nr:VOC family protein [Acidimicrobiales bacterium]
MAEFSEYEHGTPCWVDISSPDQAATRAFYTGLFGWEVEELPADAGGYAQFTLGGKVVAGTGPQMMPGMPTVWTTYVKVDDAAAVTAAATEKGATVFVEPMEVMQAGKMAMFADPMGVPIALWQPGQHFGAELANEPGAFTWNELQSRDVEAAKSFYGAVFGWGEATEDFGGMPYTQFMLGEKPVAGMLPINPMVPAEVPGFWLVYFAVTDTDATVARAGELGGSVLMPAIDSPVGRFGILNDTDGAAFAVIQLPG